MNLPTPHSGFHWDGKQYPFFEGWYYRLTLPHDQTIAFMYSFQAPDSSNFGSNSAIAQKQMGGCAVQILDPDEQYFCRSLPNLSRFWADKDRLAHGYDPDPNNRAIAESYQVRSSLHEGQFWNPASSQMIRWSYTIESIYGWGNPKSAQQSTAGWLSQFQIFEPGWQILMAHGLATGWFEKIDCANHDHNHQPSSDRLNFENVPAYAEKNWGGAFPKQWFWIQCNAFVDHPDLSLTCGGGIRKVLGLEESVGMVGIHYQGEFYEFTPWTAKLSWQVLAWGEWQVLAKGANFEIELIGKSSDIGVIVRVPTETGLKLFCRDTTKGDLQVNFWRTKGRSRSLIFSAHSQQAGLEIGGDWSGQKSWCK